MQLTAPVPLNVSVVEPAPHTRQAVCAALPWYWPAAHDAHATVDLLLYLPLSHDVQFTAPVDDSVFVTEPALQVSHATVDALLY